ncbi:putative glycosyl transferase [Emericellopsis atlantica]|uniref:Glycosyl transferase n=1 Tax=Emericellopsis atlantica TaxID=2614577 RepID=A0A9P7ZN39_9HYPO|nr:putative glycosyl transferase [Emericellopsis atlantica]KAG9254523.1 putative glycosyl transferase [Emericellopsis atlantica]
MYSRSLLLVLYKFRGAVHTAWTLISLPLYWPNGSSEFIISQESDGFDVTFANYSSFQTTAGKGVIDNVPAILHHIMLGSRAPESTWNTARQSCLDWHPGFDYHLWTDENAATFVAEKFPDLKAMWDAYRLPIQRVDALRYMILHEYGGIILDMDLQCRRSLGPLRQFKFVAPAAHPTGFSVSFLMASRANEFVGNILQNLKTYDRNWFYLPYVTVMFSTGGHFASALHARLPNRAESKILSGPLSNPKLHSLNGQAVTPIFNHLGSSSWHSFDGWFLMLLGRHIKLACILGGISVSVFTDIDNLWDRCR